jgi:hypothetical protein
MVRQEMVRREMAGPIQQGSFQGRMPQDEISQRWMMMWELGKPLNAIGEVSAVPQPCLWISRVGWRRGVMRLALSFVNAGVPMVVV